MHVFLGNSQDLLSLADTSTISPSFCVVKRTTYFVMDLYFTISSFSVCFNSPSPPSPLQELSGKSWISLRGMHTPHLLWLELKNNKKTHSCFVIMVAETLKRLIYLCMCSDHEQGRHNEVTCGWDGARPRDEKGCGLHVWDPAALWIGPCFSIDC